MFSNVMNYQPYSFISKATKLMKGKYDVIAKTSSMTEKYDGNPKQTTVVKDDGISKAMTITEKYGENSGRLPTTNPDHVTCEAIVQPDVQTVSENWGRASADNSTMVYSAYRIGSTIKIVGALRKPIPPVFCQLWNTGIDAEWSLTVVEANIRFLDDNMHQLYVSYFTLTGADPGFLERGFICIKGWGFALLIISHFS